MKPLLERAFELAATGEFKTITEIRFALKREGYQGLAAHLDGKGVRDALRRRLRGG